MASAFFRWLWRAIVQRPLLEIRVVRAELLKADTETPSVTLSIVFLNHALWRESILHRLDFYLTRNGNRPIASQLREGSLPMTLPARSWRRLDASVLLSQDDVVRIPFRLCIEGEYSEVDGKKKGASTMYDVTG